MATSGWVWIGYVASPPVGELASGYDTRFRHRILRSKPFTSGSVAHMCIDLDVYQGASAEVSWRGETVPA